jgi:tripartite ATP-independent transporter DctM subunit
MLSGFSSTLHMLARIPFDTSMTYLWSLIPLFVFMGQIAHESGLGSDLFKTAFKWFGGFRGGLALTTTVTSAGFSAVCGDNIAGAATMTTVCLREMRKYGYEENFSLATICAGGILSFLIPPSLGFIIFGLLTNSSISDLFVGGIFPGILLCIGYMVVIYIICRINPAKGPAGPKTTWGEKFASLKNLWGIVILIFVVFGGIYSGFITVTEAGALGAFGALVVGLAKRTLNGRNFWHALVNSVQTTGMVFLLIAGAWLFAPFLSLTQIPATMISFMQGWSPTLILLFTMLFFFIGGMFFDSTILMIITIPLFLPLWTTANLDMIWFGVSLMVIIIVSGITPPVGLIVYVVSGMVPGASSTGVFKEVSWFIIPAVACVILLLIFPQIATFLPDLV